MDLTCVLENKTVYKVAADMKRLIGKYFLHD